MKYGRRPRAFSPAIPHWSALRMGAAPTTVPETCDYTRGLPANLGGMLNLDLNDCAEAGYGHALQVWSVAAGKPILTEPDSCIQALYSATCGYVPGDPSTDKGTVLQDLLAYLVKTGVPLADGSRQKLYAFVELDPMNDGDLNRACYESGLLYLGMQVPRYLESAGFPQVWDISPGSDQTIAGDHCIISPGYGEDGRKIISWGSYFSMTRAFWRLYVVECYALIDVEFCAATGITPLGLPLSTWSDQMAALRMGA